MIMATIDEKKIIIVEDQPLLNMLLVELVEEFGHSTVTFFNGKEALDYLISNSADLLITDLFMPVMGGFELIEALSKEKITIPTIIVSGVEKHEIFNGLTAEAAELFQNSNLQFIEKPLNEYSIRFLKHIIDSL
jgi:CheY-like chemotaxis protein